ncbi:MAG: FAD-binding protein, partial [Thermomicrobiales bacterium]
MAVERWSNWAGNIRSEPNRVERPESVDALRRVVRDAAKRRETIRAAGSGHSFSPVCETSGTLIDLTGIAGIERIDPETGAATVLAGTKLHALGGPLLEAGRALANQGDIDRQAIAGAVSTGTHGTGRRFGSFSAQITGLEVVTPEGDLVAIDASEPERFRAARLSIGLLGVLARVTIGTVPAYKLRERCQAMPFDACLSAYPAIEAERRNAEFWWLPALDTCVVKAFEESTDEPIHPDAGEHPPGTLERYLKPEAVDWS